MIDPRKSFFARARVWLPSGPLQAEVFPPPLPNLAINHASEFVALVDRVWRVIEDDARTAALVRTREGRASLPDAKVP